MRDDRIKNKSVSTTPSKPIIVKKELHPDIKKALDEVEHEVKKEKQR